MIQKQEISTYQLLCLILLSRLLSLLTMISSENTILQSTDCLLGTVGMGIFTLLLSIPFLFFLKLYPKQTLLDVTFTLANPALKITGFLYIAFFFYEALVTILTLRLFVGIALVQNDESTWLIILCVFAACYAASLGLEAISRSSTITLGIFIFSFSLIILVMANKVNFLNFSPILEHGLSPIVWFSLQGMGATSEIAMLFFLAPKAKGNTTKMFGIWFVLWILCTVFIFIFTFGGLGKFALTQLFPVYSMAVLSDFSVFQRFDVLLTGIWILTAFLKISLLLYLNSTILNRLYPKNDNNVWIIVLGSILCLLVFLLRGKLKLYFMVAKMQIQVFLILFFTCAFPLFVMLLEQFKRKRKVKIK